MSLRTLTQSCPALVDFHRFLAVRKNTLSRSLGATAMACTKRSHSVMPRCSEVQLAPASSLRQAPNTSPNAYRRPEEWAVRPLTQPPESSGMETKGGGAQVGAGLAAADHMPLVHRKAAVPVSGAVVSLA